MTDAEKLKLYEEALRDIAYHGTSQSPAMNMPEDHWYRRVAFSMIGIASRALRGERNEDDDE